MAVELRNDNIPEFLQEILNQFEERGWCTGSRQDDDGRVCFLGAAEVAGGFKIWEHNYDELGGFPAIRYFWDSIKSDTTVEEVYAFNSDAYKVAMWNDLQPDSDSVKQAIEDVIAKWNEENDGNAYG